jgi:hypothetical protein
MLEESAWPMTSRNTTAPRGVLGNPPRKEKEVDTCFARYGGAKDKVV